MVRQSKSASASTAASTAAPAVTVVVESTPATPATLSGEKKVKKTKAPVAEVAAAPVSAPAPAVEVAAPAALPSEVPVDVATLSSKLGDFSSKIQQVAALLTSMKSDYKVLERTVARELKQASKSKGKSRKTSANKNPSGFVKPTKISDELIKFLGKEANTEMSRVEVSKEINAYINEHKLKDEKCGRQINPDAKLTKLLKINKDEVLTFFNLQRYLKIHFIKAPIV